MGRAFNAGAKAGLARSCGFDMLLMSGAIAVVAPSWAMAATATDPALDEVIVTSERREENIRTVPVSVTSYSALAMDEQGIRQIEDLSRLTPSLQFSRTSGVAGNNGANIAIRGIASDVGASTTAIYIDDTPIQIRNVGYFGGNPYPRVFDLDHVEILRGPQGTLFGAGAEGGAVRFLTTQPSFKSLGVYARSEVGSTQNGAASGELGVAVGGPVSDKLAFQVSAWDRHDGGYIDRIIPQTTTVIAKNINSQDTQAGRVALTWLPITNLTITPSVYYQDVKAAGRNQFWEGPSNISGEKFVTGISSLEPSEDKFTLTSLKAQYDFGKIALISNTSGFSRSQDQHLNYINYQSFLRTGDPFGTFANKDPTNSDTVLTTAQDNIVQEVRLQSFDPVQLIDWTTGVYYSETKQTFTNLTGSGRIPGVISSGYPQYLNRYNLYEHIHADDEQIAGFASVDIKPREGLKITLGARVTQDKFNFSDLRDGPVNSGHPTTTLASMSDTAVTPKIGVSYQLDPNDLVYADATQGFRPGGAQMPVDPGFCAADLKTLGITASPTSFKSDSLWSYEAGSKNKVADGKVLLDANAYYVHWKDIQQSIRLPTCGNSYIGNLGSATGKGLDLSAVFNPVAILQLGLNLGYNETTFDGDILGGNGLVLRRKGDGIGGPKWTGSAFARTQWAVTGKIQGYGRADYSFQSAGINPDPKAFGFDPGLPALPANDELTLRVGLRFARVDVSAFINNVTDQHKALSRSDDGAGSTLYYRETYRPRTIGLTGEVRY